jgi:hypothetical protein
MNGSYHKVKIMHTNRGPTRDGEKEEVVFFYGKVVTLGWDPDRWRWADGGHFFYYTTKAGRDSITNRTPGITRAGDKWQGYLPAITNSFGHKWGTLFVVVRKPPSFGRFGIRRLR